MNNLTTTTRKQLANTAELGAMANIAASGFIFTDYTSRKSAATVKAHGFALALFAEYLESKGAAVGDLQTTAEAWAGITWGLVEGFKAWQLGQGFAIASINNRLSAVKTYAKLAFKAGQLAEGEYLKIQAVTGYSVKEAGRVDSKRAANRQGKKKAAHTRLTLSKARELKKQDMATPQGRRDAVLIVLLLEHGLRVGELAGLQVGDIDLQVGELRFFRSKVSKTQTHKLTANSLRILGAYLAADAPQGALLMGSNKAGQLVGGMSVRAISGRVAMLGAAVGVDGLSPHDLRHYWATNAAKSGSDLLALQEAGGWSSLAMPRRYVEEGAIANEGIKLTL